MKPFKFVVLLSLGIASAIALADGQESRITLEAAREQGRSKSGYLKETKAGADTSDSIPRPNVADFQKFVAPILTKSCVNCHGPKKAKGRLRVDQLNPDLLAGLDVEKWREVYNALSKSEMPPKNEPDY